MGVTSICVGHANEEISQAASETISPSHNFQRPSVLNIGINVYALSGTTKVLCRTRKHFSLFLLNITDYFKKGAKSLAKYLNELIILQARQGSTRLPDKVLLDLNGQPVVLVAAKRASNTGLPCVVAIPDDQANLKLRSTLVAAGIDFYAGPERDVLARFYYASEHLKDDGLVIRLTSDNIFPDGKFIDSMLSFYRTSGAEYVGVDYEDCNMPYGLGAEIFRVSDLIAAHAAAETDFDREHVTPWIRQNRKAAFFNLQGLNTEARNYRATIDTRNDYELIRAVTNEVLDVVNVTPETLCSNLVDVAKRLQIVPGRLVKGRWISQAALGTAQFGLNYGVTNLTGMPSLETCTDIFNLAQDKGVSLLDTAQGYGISEERIGHILQNQSSRPMIATKLDPNFAKKFADSSPEEISRGLRVAINESRDRLGDVPEFFLLHRWTDRLFGDGLLWEELLQTKSEGLFRGLGVSVISVKEMAEAIEETAVDLIQHPFNILDHRWIDLIESAKSKGKILIARSCFLQGLLLHDPGSWPKWVNDADKICSTLELLVSNLGRKSRADLCVAYVRAYSGIWSVVFGADSKRQCQEILECFSQPPLTTAQAILCRASLSGMYSDRLLDPWRWNET